MAVYVALLRAVNVGGTGKLPMAELRALCAKAGFEDVATYIQSGNVVFTSAQPATKVTAALEAALKRRMGKPVGVFVRTPAQLAKILDDNPFADAPPNRVLVFFLERAASKAALAAVKVPGREQLEARGREVYVHYPDGMGKSKLRLPFAADGTARNVNTVRHLLEMGRELARR